MANEDLIRGGTASIANGQVAVAGQSVSWSAVNEGDFFGAHVGLAIPIAARNGSNLTLAYPWPGPTQVAAAYAIQPKGDVTRFQERVRQLIETLANGTVAAVAAAGSGADKISVFTGAGTAELATVTPYARTLLDDLNGPAMRQTIGALSKSGEVTTANYTFGHVTATGDVKANSLESAYLIKGSVVRLNENTAGAGTAVENYRNGKMRWGLYMNGVAETGGDTGSDFSVDAYSDAGVWLGATVAISL